MSDFEPKFDATTYEKAKEQIIGVDTSALDEIIDKGNTTIKAIKRKEAPTREADKREAANILNKFFGIFPESIPGSQTFNNAIKEYAPKLGEQVTKLTGKYKQWVDQLLKQGNPQEKGLPPQSPSQSPSINTTTNKDTSPIESASDIDSEKKKMELLKELEGTTIKALGKEIPLNPNELTLEDKGNGIFLIKSSNPKFSYIKTELLIDQNGVLKNKEIKIDAGLLGNIAGANGNYSISQDKKSIQLNKIG